MRSEPPPALEEIEDRTLRMIVMDGAPENDSTEDVTRFDNVEVFRPPGTDFAVITGDELADLRQRLRAAEQREDREDSGIRPRTTPQDGLPWALRETIDHDPEDVDPLADLEILVEPPRSFDEWTESISSLPEIEVAVAPLSESNFYGGFDPEHPDGVFLATYRDLPLDTPVYAVVHLPAGYRFRTPALVEFVREPEAATDDAPAGVGLRMCGLDNRMRRLIREFVKHRPPMFYVG